MTNTLTPKLYLKHITRMAFGLLVFVMPNIAFGYSFIDLGLMTNAGANQGVSQAPIEEREEFSIDVVEESQQDILSKVRADARVQALTITDEKVELVYGHQGKILSLLPVSYNVTATVHADGRVDVEYPWYQLFLKDDSAEVESQIQLAVSDVFEELDSATVDTINAGTSTDLVLEAKFTKGEADRVLEQMYSVLKAQFNTQVDDRQVD